MISRYDPDDAHGSSAVWTSTDSAQLAPGRQTSVELLNGGRVTCHTLVFQTGRPRGSRLRVRWPSDMAADTPAEAVRPAPRPACPISRPRAGVCSASSGISSPARVAGRRRWSVLGRVHAPIWSHTAIATAERTAAR